MEQHYPTNILNIASHQTQNTHQNQNTNQNQNTYQNQNPRPNESDQSPRPNESDQSLSNVTQADAVQADQTQMGILQMLRSETQEDTVDIIDIRKLEKLDKVKLVSTLCKLILDITKIRNDVTNNEYVDDPVKIIKFTKSLLKIYSKKKEKLTGNNYTCELDIDVDKYKSEKEHDENGSCENNDNNNGDEHDNEQCDLTIDNMIRRNNASENTNGTVNSFDYSALFQRGEYGNGNENAEHNELAEYVECTYTDTSSEYMFSETDSTYSADINMELDTVNDALCDVHDRRGLTIAYEGQLIEN
jgi:hypothetical protein